MAVNTIDKADVVKIADAIPVGIAIADLTGNLLFVNHELERMTGYPSAELLGQSVDLLLPERNRERHVAEREHYVRQPTTRHMGVGRELFARRRDGTEFPVEVGLRPIETASGQGILASIIDVSARREVESGFRAIIEASPYGMVLTDAKGNIVMINQRLGSMFGYAEAELVGKQIEMLLPERHRGNHVPFRDAFFDSPAQRAMGGGRDLTGRRKDGIEIPVEIGLSSVVGAKGRMAIAAVTDITERKRAELQLREANAQLEEFSYVASHDLRSPIRGVANLIDFIREDLGEDAPSDALRNLNRMQERIARMERLIDDLLTYARAGKRTVKFEPIDLFAVVEDVVKLYPAPDAMQVEIDLAVQPFEGARTPLTTVMRNLYSNAIKHHDRPDGRITLRAREDGNYCVIDVIDDGPGIPEQTHRRVFRLFQTLTATERLGSGLGLAVSKRLVEGHGGRIELYSKDGHRGCRFRVWWPRFMRSDLDD